MKQYYSFEKILAYLEGNLSEEEIWVIEEMMQENEDLTNLVREIERHWHMSIFKGKEPRNLQPTFQPKLEELRSRSEKSPDLTSKPAKVKHLTILLSVAASVLFLFLAYWFFFPEKSFIPCDLDSAPIIAMESGLYEEKITTFGANGSSDSDPLEKIFALYNEEKFGEVIEKGEPLWISADSSLAMQEMTVCLSVSFVMEKQAEQSLPYLRMLREYSELEYTFTANWYESLVLLELGKRQQAIDMLKQVVKDDWHWSEEAKMILNCLL